MLQKIGDRQYEVPEPPECCRVPVEFFVIGLRPESAWLLVTKKDGHWCGWGYDGNCPKCGSDDLRDKGGYDKCNECGFSVDFSYLIFED